MSKRKKKRSIMDIATTIILIVCAIGFVGMVVSIVYTKNKDKMTVPRPPGHSHSHRQCRHRRAEGR